MIRVTPGPGAWIKPVPVPAARPVTVPVIAAVRPHSGWQAQQVPTGTDSELELQLLVTGVTSSNEENPSPCDCPS